MHPANQTKDQRVCARRDQIVAASRLCFRKHGFHGAGMAEIAKMSQLSVGQIYRYFVNKDAIIEEIVRRIVFKKIQIMTGGAHNLKQMASNLAYRVIGVQNIDHSKIDCPELSPEQNEIDHALMLEVTAEATRNPVVEKILRDAESKLFNEAKAMMTPYYPDMPEKELTARLEMMAVMCEGTAFRRLTQAHADPETLKTIYNQVFLKVFSDSTPSHTPEN
ncbi:TetR/AcrR family transcriptional regulator [Rouxiella badensis]|jgi:AcrR family transcriptional regulator|uniref:TetR family transcriptional regulator n=1 Tax=Rouxiella badensis TaxID=1646377 RepID=A0A1X0WLF2_9GAMM|nr:TetR/AcrR family transcriptional regulator [Rouxiella badensis]MCC3702273.1 TetR/AcrR family transcriptional regulator [Rouxiella badensis]MCC3717279.1 TetR/AcrR family transcriptional regulator [Rouxiella badensis]MCC3728375.1 TetR/AcrR family transcriptional regulator [Rouxiella badensis]MCC3740119.1 TetR/AcrR family transcriptional regulator [Rouxiella badensis]MCC3745543.1 TetR/AcrR family transcriptional regulator [Rouxiella badensis]